MTLKKTVVRGLAFLMVVAVICAASVLSARIMETDNKAGAEKLYKNTMERILAEDGFIYGINVPWFSGQSYANDIGTSVLMGRTASGYDAGLVRQVFTNAKATGFNCVRIWLFEVVEGLQFDRYGNCTGVQKEFVKNLTEMLDIAVELGVVLDVTYFCHISFVGNEAGRDKYNWLTQYIFDRDKWGGTMDNIIRPVSELLSGYQDNILCVDIYAEPEGDIYGRNGNANQQYGTSWPVMAEFLKMCVETVRSVMPDMPVTVSSGWTNYSALQSGLYNELGLDFIGVDIYNDTGTVLPVRNLMVNAPVVLAEFGPVSAHDWSDEFQSKYTAAFYRNARANGYIGAFLWMYGYFNSTESATLVGQDSNLRPAAAVIRNLVNDVRYEMAGSAPALDKPEMIYLTDTMDIQWFGSRNAQRYLIERSADGQSWAELATVSAASVDNGRGYCGYSDATAEEKTDYYYRVTAISGPNRATSGPSTAGRVKKLFCSEEENLIVDGGFETGGIPQYERWGADNAVQFYVTDEDSHSGAYSLKMDGQNNWNGVAQRVECKANTFYTFSMWAKAERNASGGNSCFNVLDGKTASHDLQGPFPFVYNGEWMLYTFDVYTRDNTSLIFYFADGGGEIFIDDVYLFMRE